MKTSSSTSDISNCISAPFAAIDGKPTGSWSLCYNPATNALVMNMTTDPDDKIPRTTNIDQSGLSDMIQFLAQVRMTMEGNAKKER